MSTHSNILAWRIPWTEESGGLQSMGSQSRSQLSDQHFPLPMSDDNLQPEPFTWHPFKFCFLSLPISGHISFSWLWFHLTPLTVLRLSSLASLLIFTSYFLFGIRLISCTLGKALPRPAKPCSLSNFAQTSWLPPFHPKGPDPDIQSPAIK